MVVKTGGQLKGLSFSLLANFYTDISAISVTLWKSDLSTCAVSVGYNRGSWLGGVCPRPQDWGRDPLPLLSEPGHPKLVLRGWAKVGHCSSREEKLTHDFKISTSPCYFGTHEGHWRYRLTEASCLCWKNSCKMCLIVVRERVNINLTWAWASWLLDVNPAVVKVW